MTNKLSDDTIDTLLFYLLETKEFGQAEEILTWLDKGYEIYAGTEAIRDPFPTLYAKRDGAKKAQLQFPIDMAHQDSLNVIQEILRQEGPERIVEGFAIDVLTEMYRGYEIRFRDTAGSAVTGVWRFRFDRKHGLRHSYINYMPTRRRIEAPQRVWTTGIGFLYLGTVDMQQYMLNDGIDDLRLKDQEAMTRLMTALDKVFKEITHEG